MTKRVEICIEKEFYFEGIYILGSLIENIPKNIMKKLKGNNEIKLNKNDFSFDNAIQYVRKEKIISENLCNRLDNWRINRNKLVHSLIKSAVDETELSTIVIDGKKILELLEAELNEQS